MNVIKQTVTATWRRSTVASQEAPQPKCETAISGWQSIIASWLRPRSGAHFLLVRPSGWRVAPRRVPLGRRSPGRRHLHAPHRAPETASLVRQPRASGVKPDGDETMRNVVDSVRTAACGWFTTGLGPGADATHTDHLHVDMALHGTSDRYRICQ